MPSKVARLKDISKETRLSETQLRVVCEGNMFDVHDGAAGAYISLSDRRRLLQIIGPVKQPYRYKRKHVQRDLDHEVQILLNRLLRLRQGVTIMSRADGLLAVERLRKDCQRLSKHKKLTTPQSDNLMDLEQQLNFLRASILTLPTEVPSELSRSPTVSAGLPTLGRRNRR